MCVNCGVQGCGCNPSHIQIPVGPAGPTGMTGPIGPPGQNGTNGRSIINSNYDPTTGVVTFYYSDNTTSVTGDLRGAPGQDGTAGSGVAGSIVNNLTSNQFSDYNDFLDSDLAKWRASMHPTGLISMFAASSANFANGYGIDLQGGSNLLGWAICDGSSYQKSVTGLPGGDTLISPDLTGKFIVGVDGATFQLGDVGGSVDHDHDIDPLTTNQIPKHKHGVSGVTLSPHKHGKGTLAATAGLAGLHRHQLKTDGDGTAEGTIDNDAGGFSDFGENDNAMKDAGEHTHPITISGETDFQTSTVGLSGLTDENASSQQGITTKLGENLPPYYSLIYLIKI